MQLGECEDLLPVVCVKKVDEPVEQQQCEDSLEYLYEIGGEPRSQEINIPILFLNVVVQVRHGLVTPAQRVFLFAKGLIVPEVDNYHWDQHDL